MFHLTFDVASNVRLCGSQMQKTRALSVCGWLCVLGTKRVWGDRIGRLSPLELFSSWASGLRNGTLEVDIAVRKAYLTLTALFPKAKWKSQNIVSGTWNSGP